MKLLLIDTCGTNGTIALADTDHSPAIVATATLPDRTASERLIPAIKNLLADQGLNQKSLGAIAVVHGPGSFTGVRIGLSAAKGLCEALDLQLIGLSRLAVLANLTPPAHRTHALLDAGRGEFYHGEYVDGICLREALLTRDQVLAVIAEPENQSVVVCEPKVAESLTHLIPTVVPEPTAADALPLALRRIRDGQFDDVATIDANYVRRTDAEIFAKPKPAQPPEALRK